MTLARLNNLTASLRTSKLDAVILNPGPTLTYLTGLQFHLMERPVVLFVAPGKDPVLVLPELELPKVDLFPYKVQAFAYGELPSEWDDAFRKAAQALGSGWEADRRRAASTAFAGIPSCKSRRARSGISRCKRCVIPVAIEER